MNSTSQDIIEVRLPRDLGAHNAAQTFAQYVIKAGGRFPALFKINMSGMQTISPAGVIFLSNLSNWNYFRGAKVEFTGLFPKSSAVDFLDRCLFFQKHCNARLDNEAPSPATVIPLQFVWQKDSHMWLRGIFVPWLASQLGVTYASLDELQTCLSELFNNIADHSSIVAGSLLAQHVPNEKKVTISISDFGVGIPEMVRRVKPELSDSSAICQAVERGFTTKTTPKNQGEGLAYLLDNVVMRYNGKVSVLSGRAIVTFRNRGGRIYPVVKMGNYFCPGTLFDIVLRTNAIENVEDAREDLTW